MTLFKLLNWGRVGILMMLAPALSVAQQAVPPATPEQVIAEVRAAQAAAAAGTPGGGTFAVVPAPTGSAAVRPPVPIKHPIRHAPTLEDKKRLEARLRYVNSALKIRTVTDGSTQRASDAIASRGEMLFTFTPGGIYEVQTAVFHETAFELQPGEVLTGKDLPTAGDTTRWTIAVTRTGVPPTEITVLLVKPLEADLETNMTITTNKRLYTVILRSNETTYMPLVGWLYPQDEARALEANADRARQAEEQSEALSVAPDALNFNCKITGSRVAWRPLQVYDDGTKTYLQMSPDMQSSEAPAIFVLEKRAPLLVNFRVKRSIYIVDRLFDRAQLRVGPKTTVDITCVHRLASR